MKKFLLMALASFVSIFASAQINESEAEDMTKVVYAKSGAVQRGATGTIDIVLKSDETVGCIACWFTLPDGVTVDVSGSTSQGGITYNFHNGLHKFTIQNGSYWAASGSTPYVIASIKVNVPAGVELGEYPLYTQHWEVTTPGLLTIEGDVADNQNILANVTVQKTAVIEPLTDGYSLEVLPFVAKEGASTIDVLFKSAATAKSVTFDIELPQGMMFYDENFDPSKPVLNASACTKTPTTSLTITDASHANKASVSVMGQNTGAAALRKYINQLDELTTLVSIPVYVVPADEIADWGENYELKEGVYTAKLNNIVVTDYASNTTFTGNYLASVIVGQPSAQEAILYGHYNEATASAFTTALKNVAIADVTAATVDDGAKFTDVLVNEKSGNSYYTRTSENYGTTVLPWDLTPGSVDELYTIESMDSESIVLTKAENVAANTPCIFKGTINVDGATPTLGVPSEQGLGQTTFKGTYQSMYLEQGAGYYISSNGKFYNDGATVRPFRGYFEGNVSGVKSFSVLLDTEDGLIDITNQFSEEDIYSLQGTKLNKAKKGVNIINGKKVLKK